MEPGSSRPRLQTYPGIKQENASFSVLDQQRSKSNQLKDGNESPESGSLYSDEIPSGYNSGEQYDTISCGYMSGEAYELPDTRMELHEPALEVIEECIQPLGTADSDENIFRMPAISMGTPDVGNPSTFINMEQDEQDNSSTSSGCENKAESESIMNMGGSPMITFGKKHRKKPLSFSIPLESGPLNKDDVNEIYDESSDAGMGDAPTGGYRAVPSDTDTSAVDSDPNAMDGRHKRLGKRKRSMKNHDEAWFMANDTKNWSRARFVCFWSSITCMVAACILAGVLIFFMPRNCDPSVEWYQGKVIMDIKPEDDGSFDLAKVKSELKHLKEMGVSALHLKHLKSKVGQNSPTANHVELTTKILGDETEIKSFLETIHGHNLTIIVQIPIVNNKSALDLDLEHAVDVAIKFWMKHGADGIFLDGLEAFEVNVWVAKKIAYWHSLLDRFGTHSYSSDKSRILMTSYKFAKQLTDQVEDQDSVQAALDHISLLDAHLDLDSKSNITLLGQNMEEISHWDTIQSRPWINWNLETSVPLSNAAMAFQMLLPGTINLSFKDLDNKDLKNMTTLRALAVPIYMNGNYKRCECESGTTKEVNYILKRPIEDTVQLERFYNRRNRYVLVANFGQDHVNLGPVGKIYSGGELVLDTSQSLPEDISVTKFSAIDLQPDEAIVIKLPK